VPPTDRPLPRFVAEPPHELEPYGRWAERLAETFLATCARIDGAPVVHDAAAIEWHPERTWAGRVYVPATVAAGDGEELFGHVSFARDERGEPVEFRAVADFTDDTAAQNPDWSIDLSDEVIGAWHGPGEASGEVTLVWGTPLGSIAAGCVAATAELDGELVDQCELGESRRFTLVALDAVKGMGLELYLEIKLWGRDGRELASESLYADEEE
jgi:hypothetical protein